MEEEIGKVTGKIRDKYYCATAMHRYLVRAMTGWPLYYYFFFLVVLVDFAEQCFEF